MTRPRTSSRNVFKTISVSCSYVWMMASKRLSSAQSSYHLLRHGLRQREFWASNVCHGLVCGNFQVKQ